MTSQCDRVLKYIKSYVGITQDQAREELGVARLSARIFDLKTLGVPIVGVWKEVTNRYGEICKIKEYRLDKEKYKELKDQKQ